MALTGLTLVGTNAALAEAWRAQFDQYPSIPIVHGSIFDVTADALVSPANSFGVMDGGLDGQLRDYFGVSVERRVRERIATQFDGELPVGLAIVVETSHERHPYLISAPTMRCPGNVSGTINAYLAMKALLHAASNHAAPLHVAIPGLCALTGAMHVDKVARQMRIAYERVVVGLYRFTHWREERDFERFIRGDSVRPPAS